MGFILNCRILLVAHEPSFTLRHYLIKCVREISPYARNPNAMYALFDMAHQIPRHLPVAVLRQANDASCAAGIK